MSLQIIIRLQILVTNFANEGFRRIRGQCGDVGFGLHERRRGGVAGGRRHGATRNAGAVTRMHQRRHHIMSIVCDFSFDFSSSCTTTTSRTDAGSGGDAGGIESQNGQSVDVFPMTLEIVIVMEDLLTDFAWIFSSGIFRLRSSVNADTMTPQVETILYVKLVNYNTFLCNLDFIKQWSPKI